MSVDDFHRLPCVVAFGKGNRAARLEVSRQRIRIKYEVPYRIPSMEFPLESLLGVFQSTGDSIVGATFPTFDTDGVLNSDLRFVDDIPLALELALYGVN